MKNKIFISYASADRGVAFQLVEYIEKQGVTCFIAPRDVDASAPYAKAIIRGMESASGAIVVCSAAINDSEHVLNEVEVLTSMRKSIILFCVEEYVMSDEYRYYLGRTQRILAYPSAPQYYFVQLYEALRALLPTQHVNSYDQGLTAKHSVDADHEPQQPKRAKMTPYEGDEPYIFVSYAHKDSDVVMPILEALDESGYRVWYDAGIEAGTEWPDYIAEHIENSTAMIIFLSKNSIDSSNCRQEINYGIDLGLPMLSVYIEELSLKGGLRMRLGLIQSMFLYRHPSLESFMTELRRASLLAPCRDGAPDTEQHYSAQRTVKRSEPVASAPKASEPQSSASSDFIVNGGQLVKYVGKGSHADIPEGVTVIGERAFSNCTQLVSVSFPSTLNFISPYAFSNCRRLVMVHMPKSVWGIGGYAFEGCDSLGAAFISRSVTLGGEAFPSHTDVTYL